MCCPQCFNDDVLSAFIGRNGGEHQNCVYCLAEGVPTIDPAKLEPYFESVLEGYAAKGKGRHLWDLWHDDWQMFSAATSAQQIVESVLGEAIARATYVARESASAPSSEVWAKLRKELQEENRFFPRNAPDKEIFRSLIENLVRTELPQDFYRCRLMREGGVYLPSEMGAPPADVGSEGRANPIGIQYLYLADNAETAIAEVKPSKGALVALARFTLTEGRGVTLIDLTNPRLTISPFRVTSSISEVRASMSFLEALGEELSVPTQPHRATKDYLASQYLCELIKVCGYDGVVYRSSLAAGRNFALFDALACAPVGDVLAYRVSDIAITARLEPGRV